jgi:CheY-like chemotaxis protein
MNSELRILHLEDDSGDAELIQETLEADGISCRVTHVETEADFVASLEEGGFDLIFADYTLPTFDGMSALKIAHQTRPHVPFIFVSGTLDEEVAIEALKIGATGVAGSRRESRTDPRRRGAAAQRSLFGRGTETEPHRQLRLECLPRRNLLVARDLSHV